MQLYEFTEAYQYDLKEWKAFVVDGVKIKAGIYYTLKDGELVKV